MDPASLSGDNPAAGLYNRMRGWRDQLEELLNENKDQERVVQDRTGRVVTVTEPQPGGLLDNIAGFFSYLSDWGSGDDGTGEPEGDRAEEAAPEKLFKDISIMQRTVVELNNSLGLSDGSKYVEEDISISTVRNCFRECDRLMASQAGQLLRTRNHLENLWELLQKNQANPENSLGFIGDELQTCFARFLATTRPEDEFLESFGKFNSFVTMWLDEKKEAIATTVPSNPALDVAYQQLNRQCREFLEYSVEEIRGKPHVVLEELRHTPSPPGDAIPKESARGDIMSLVETSRKEVRDMTIPEERFPDGRQMLMDDLEQAEQIFLQELKDLPQEKVTKHWYQDIRERLLKMRETMYYAMRSPDRKPPFYPARVGLHNRHIDCEPNSHAQAYSHLSCYDYFLHRVLPVPSLPQGTCRYWT